jgi:hypothetical protein
MNIVYITIISIIITIIVTTCAYFGWIRYYKLKKTKCELYIETYTKLPRVLSKSKVVVSLYIPNDKIDVDNITLKSILDQSVHPDQIIIVTNPNTYVPEMLKKDNIITSQTSTSGPLSAFLTPITTQKDTNTKIIIITNGVCYGPDFIESIIDESNNNEDSVIFIEGYNASDYTSNKIKFNFIPQRSMLSKQRENGVTKVLPGHERMPESPVGRLDRFAIATTVHRLPRMPFQ